MIIKLKSSIAVNPDQVASVEIKSGYHGSVLVTMTDGRTYTLEPQHREGVYQAHDRILSLLNQKSGAA